MVYGYVLSFQFIPTGKVHITLGSILALIGMPLTALITRNDLSTVSSKRSALSATTLNVVTVRCIYLSGRLSRLPINNYRIPLRALAFPQVH